MIERPIRKLQDVSERKYKLQEPISSVSAMLGFRELDLELTAIDVMDFGRGAAAEQAPTKTRSFLLGVTDRDGLQLRLTEEQATELFHLLGMELGFAPAKDE